MFDNNISKTYVNQLSTTKHCFLINYQSLYLEIRAITNIKSILSIFIIANILKRRLRLLRIFIRLAQKTLRKNIGVGNKWSYST